MQSPFLTAGAPKSALGRVPFRARRSLDVKSGGIVGRPLPRAQTRTRLGLAPLEIFPQRRPPAIGVSPIARVAAGAVVATRHSLPIGRAGVACKHRADGSTSGALSDIRCPA